jgi:PAS domain S-box-containing protein
LKSKKIISKCFIALALTFIIPQMVFVYLWEDLSSRLSLLLLACTLFLVGIGCYLIWDIVQSIRSVFKNIEEITADQLNLKTAPTEDEFRFMGNSIEIISKRIVENMQELQRSAQVLENTKKELNETLVYVENVMNSMGDALIVIDPHFQIKKFNRAAEELLQYTGSDVLNQPIELVFEEIGQNLFSHEAIVEGRRMTFITKENKKIPVDVNVRPLLDVKGPLLGYVLVARDMRMTLELISRLENMNASLEETVRKRTGIIEKIYDELKMKDAQILQQEKMASIGVLAAGIAHEINNPVGYINSNLEVLQDNVRDIVSYLKNLEDVFPNLIQQGHSDQPMPAAIQELKELRSKLRIEDIFQDIEEIVHESKQGIDRIKRIIVDLKKFSHTDENKMDLADINQEIESTLNIVANELKYKVKVVKELGSLPSIECFPHQLNQVFMNILVNAAQAIEGQGSIFIQTAIKNDFISVIIRDTGTGIPAENLQKIFDPFFTTKAVGKGTGLGLYIAYGIIEKHRGKISVQSEVGKGTTFTIQLPIHPSHVDAAAVPS